jgi:hypothetical protein
MEKNQKYWQRFDWEKFRQDVRVKKCHPIINSLAYDDLRRLAVVLNFSNPGQYDSSFYQYSSAAIPLNPNAAYLQSPTPFKYKADYEVSTFDMSHGMGTPTGANGEQKVYSGRWLRWKNRYEIPRTACYCKDTTNGTKDWSPTESYLIGFIKFYKPNGNLYTALQNNTNNPPVKADGTPDTNNWSLFFAGPPCCYWDNTKDRIQSKIHPDTWIINSNYSKGITVSWQGAWQLKDVLPAIVKNIPPHLWKGDTWGGGQYPKGKLVLDNNSPNIKVYRAIQKIINTSQNQTIESTHPEQLPSYWQRVPELDIYWTKLNTEWNTSNSAWQLVTDSGNYINDFSNNFPGKVMYFDIKLDTGADDIEEFVITEDVECHPSLFFPKQVLPTEQYEHIIRAYKEQDFATFSGIVNDRYAKDNKCKVPLSQLHITDPSTLGPCYEARSRVSYYKRWSETRNLWVWGMRDVDGNNILAQHTTKMWNFPGNQYCNYGGAIRYNTPAGQGGTWSENPKITGALQNHLEVILSDACWRYPANGIFSANWRLIKALGSSDPSNSEQSDWDAYPLVTDECWGENESGIELFLKISGLYDWYYDDEFVYTPSSMRKIAIRHEIAPFNPNNTPSESQLNSQWKLIPVATLRRGFHNTMGRYRNFMRAMERDSDVSSFRKQAWNPSFTPYTYGINYNGSSGGAYTYDASAKWFGSRINEVPAINKFDDYFTSITPQKVKGIQWRANQPYKKGTIVNHNSISYFAKQDVSDLTNNPASNNQYGKLPIYSFTVSGNRVSSSTETDNLKVGWMLHLCDGSSDLISLDSDNMKSLYIVDLKYNEIEGKTYVTMNEEICKGTQNNNTYFSTIGWSKNISERHDGTGATYSFDNNYVMTSKIHYTCKPELLLEMFDLIKLAKYKDVSVNRTTAGNSFAMGTVYGSCGGQAYRAKELLASQLLANINDYNMDNGFSSSIQIPGDYNTTVDVGAAVGGEEPIEVGSFSNCGDVRGEQPSYYEKIVKYEWPETLKNPPKTVLAKYRLDEFYNYEQFVVVNEYTGELSFYLKEMPQSCTVGGFTCSSHPIDIHYLNRERPNDGYEDEPPLKSYFEYVPLSSTGKWHRLIPKTLFPQSPGGHGYGEAWMHMSDVTTNKIITILDSDDAPEEFFNVAFIHVDAPRDITTDNKPPTPKPIHHYNPYTVLYYALPYYLLTKEQQDAIPFWNKYDNYSANDKVKHFVNGKYHLYKALENITGDESNVSPNADPTKWEWQKPYVQLRLYATSCLCQDVSNPVLYKLICSNPAYSTEFTGDRNKMIELKRIEPIIVAAINVYSYDQSINGRVIKLYYTGNLQAEAGDKIELIRGFNNQFEGVYQIIEAGTDSNGTYITFDFSSWSDDFEGIQLSWTLILNRSKTYNHAQWLIDGFGDLTFAFQARDSANTCQGVPDNYTEVGNALHPQEPTDYINYWDN